MTWLHDDFPHPADLYYLNHAAVGAWPTATQTAITAFAAENSQFGATHYPQWLAKEQSLRKLLQRLIHADSYHEIALLKNTSEALSVIAFGLDWQPSDNIVLSAWEFPSNKIVWEAVGQRYGVEVRLVPCTHANPEQALLDACDQHTKLLSSSSVHYADGFAMNLEKLGQFCQQHDILFCVDAIQSLGAIPFDAQACYADFVVADGHKWMLAPEGLALFYCRASVRERITLNQYGWHMLVDAGDYDQKTWQIAPDAQRFESGSPNMLGIHGLAASLAYLLDTASIKTVHDNISRNIAYIIDFIKNNTDFELQTCTDKARLSGIVNFKIDDRNEKAIYKQLMQEKLICAYRGGGIRLSPHFYQDEAFIEKAMLKLVDVVQRFAAL